VRQRAAASTSVRTGDRHARRVKHPAVTTMNERSAWPTVQVQRRLPRCRSGRTRSSAPRNSAASWGSLDRFRFAVAVAIATPTAIRVVFNGPNPAHDRGPRRRGTRGSPSPTGLATIVLDGVRHRHMRVIEREGLGVGGDRCAGRGDYNDNGDGMLGELEHDGLLDFVDSGLRLHGQSSYEQTATDTSGSLPTLRSTVPILDDRGPT
jgi:hypothetical protein